MWSHWQTHCSAPRLWCDVTFSLLCIGSGDLLGFCVLSAASQNSLWWLTRCCTGNLQVWRWDESCEAILTSQMSSTLSKLNLKLLEERMIPQDSFWFSRKLSACTNSRYQAVFFFSPPTNSLGTRLEWYQQEWLTVFLHFLQLVVNTGHVYMNWIPHSAFYCLYMRITWPLVSEVAWYTLGSMQKSCGLK